MTPAEPWSLHPCPEGGALTGTVELDGATARLVLRGELDVATSGQLDAALRRLLAGGLTTILVDLGAVDFVDCAGLRQLRAAAVAAEAAGGGVRLENPSPLVQRLLELTGLDLGREG